MNAAPMLIEGRLHDLGDGMDVRPHPHIGLAIVTWLFEGAIRHRDSLGSCADIHPGELNWMTTGRGIVHSERTPPALRARAASRLWNFVASTRERIEQAKADWLAQRFPKVPGDEDEFIPLPT